MMKRIAFLFLVISSVGGVFGQDISSSKFSIKGYLTNMQSVMFTKMDGEWIADNLFHNRINLFYYPSQSLTASVQFRNRFMYGQTVELDPGYARNIDNGDSYLDLSLNIFNEKSFFLNSTIDRAYVQYTHQNFVATVGRQRINWGQSFVWNPNDIFNVQNYFDFDYIEKPGSDAVRFQYYTGYASDAEVAAKLDKEKRLTAAGYFRFNALNYDFQVLGGLFAGEDLMAGLGWSGSIKGAGFRGETSYFRSKDHFRDTTGLLYIDLSADYTFRNSLYLQVEGLYAKLPGTFSLNDFLLYYQRSLDVRQLAFTRWNLFTNVSYPVTPLLTASLAGMYFPALNGYYAGPDIDYSLKENMKLSFIMQIFSGEFPDQPGAQIRRNHYYFGFLRYKFSF